jgi:hypothetical protein
MKNVLTISEEEKNRIRGLHLAESKDKRISSLLTEKNGYDLKPKCVHVNFDRGGKIIPIEIEEDIVDLMYEGMDSDRPFITVEVGTSGTGSDEDNRRMMDDRVNEALKFIIKGAKDVLGRSGLPYSESAIMNKVDKKTKYNTIEPGSVLPTGEQVPTDEDDPYFRRYQYVRICFNIVPDTPGYDSLADQFMEATIRNNLGYSEETVYGILDKLRDKSDFEEFSAELERSYGMDFYEIACDKIAVDLTPGWMDKILGTSGEVTLATEIGPGDTTINVHLKRLGVRPISC